MIPARSMILALIALAAGVSSASAQGYPVAPRGRAARRALTPPRPPVVVVYPPSTYRVYTMPANPRQRPSAYDFIEYDTRRPHWSFDNNLWMGRNF